MKYFVCLADRSAKLKNEAPQQKPSANLHILCADIGLIASNQATKNRHKHTQKQTQNIALQKKKRPNNPAIAEFPAENEHPPPQKK